eukprot:Rhum_TRINITY_DN4561_c0_g1::Rhum_TRINITY_DN4561_c0_g1_i1::g.14843::m.14843
MSRGAGSLRDRIFALVKGCAAASGTNARLACVGAASVRLQAVQVREEARAQRRSRGGQGGEREVNGGDHPACDVPMVLYNVAQLHRFAQEAACAHALATFRNVFASLCVLLLPLLRTAAVSGGDGDAASAAPATHVRVRRRVWMEAVDARKDLFVSDDLTVKGVASGSRTAGKRVSPAAGAVVCVDGVPVATRLAFLAALDRRAAHDRVEVSFGSRHETGDVIRGKDLALVVWAAATVLPSFEGSAGAAEAAGEVRSVVAAAYKAGSLRGGACKPSDAMLVLWGALKLGFDPETVSWLDDNVSAQLSREDFRRIGTVREASAKAELVARYVGVAVKLAARETAARAGVRHERVLGLLAAAAPTMCHKATRYSARHLAGLSRGLATMRVHEPRLLAALASKIPQTLAAAKELRADVVPFLSSSIWAFSVLGYTSVAHSLVGRSDELMRKAAAGTSAVVAKERNNEAYKHLVATVVWAVAKERQERRGSDGGGVAADVSDADVARLPAGAVAECRRLAAHSAAGPDWVTRVLFSASLAGEGADAAMLSALTVSLARMLKEEGEGEGSGGGAAMGMREIVRGLSALVNLKAQTSFVEADEGGGAEEAKRSSSSERLSYILRSVALRDIVGRVYDTSLAASVARAAEGRTLATGVAPSAAMHLAVQATRCAAHLHVRSASFAQALAESIMKQRADVVFHPSHAVVVLFSMSFLSAKIHPSLSDHLCRVVTSEIQDTDAADLASFAQSQATLGLPASREALDAISGQVHHVRESVTPTQAASLILSLSRLALSPDSYAIRLLEQRATHRAEGQGRAFDMLARGLWMPSAHEFYESTAEPRAPPPPTPTGAASPTQYP